MEQWDRDFINLVTDGHFAFWDKRRGRFQFGALEGYIDYRIESFGDSERMEFSWGGYCPGKFSGFETTFIPVNFQVAVEYSVVRTPDMLAEVPLELLHELKQATLVLNRETSLKVISCIADQSPEIAAGLKKLVDNYRSAELRDLLEKASV